ncbi:MAG: tRNA (adenosine(37)-N6)-threonylcarbamoyltransferase complex ATPase subunit type 1 TsaE [Pleurocapsa sp.]
MSVAIALCLKNSQATRHLGYLLGKLLPPGSVILLEGDLGAGKTTLVQGIAKGLEIDEPIVSPTFTLINEYTDGRLPLYHLDLYRLKPSEVDSIYPEMYWEGIEVAPGITAIEWQQRLSDKPPQYLYLQLNSIAESDVGRIAALEIVGDSTLDLDSLKDRLQTTNFDDL